MGYGNTKKDLGEVYGDAKKHPWITFGILSVMLFSTLGLVAVATWISTKVEHFASKPGDPDFLKKTLTYKVIGREITPGGLYRALFEINLTNPAGNTNTAAIIKTDLGGVSDVECSEGSRVDTIQPGVGVATSTQKWLVDCQSREQILDNGSLFSLIGESNE